MSDIITLEVLSTKIDHNGEQLKQLREDLNKWNDAIGERIGCVESDVVNLKGVRSADEVIHENTEKTIERLQKKSDRWDLFNSFLAFIGGGIAWLLGNK